MAVVFTGVIFDNNQAGMALSRLYFWRLEAGGKSRQPADEIKGLILPKRFQLAVYPSSLCDPTPRPQA